MGGGIGDAMRSSRKAKLGRKMVKNEAIYIVTGDEDALDRFNQFADGLGGVGRGYWSGSSKKQAESMKEYYENVRKEEKMDLMIVYNYFNRVAKSMRPKALCILVSIYRNRESDEIWNDDKNHLNNDIRVEITKMVREEYRDNITLGVHEMLTSSSIQIETVEKAINSMSPSLLDDVLDDYDEGNGVGIVRFLEGCPSCSILYNSYYDDDYNGNPRLEAFVYNTFKSDDVMDMIRDSIENSNWELDEDCEWETDEAKKTRRMDILLEYNGDDGE